MRQRRTAGLIPDWLNSSASPTLHVAAAICIRAATILSVSVSCAPHLTHAAAAQQLDKAITPDGVSSTGSPHAARRFTDRHSRRRREQCGHGRAASVKCHVGCTDLTSAHARPRHRRLRAAAAGRHAPFNPRAWWRAVESSGRCAAGRTQTANRKLTALPGFVDHRGGGRVCLDRLPAPQFAPQTQTPEPASGASGDPAAIVAAIESLAGLHQRGILSDEEFAAKKAELLGRL